VNGRRVLQQVIRTQTATSRPGFDVDAVLRGVVEEARTLTGAEAATIILHGAGRIASTASGVEAGSSLAVPLPASAPTAGALTVYSGADRHFTAEDRQVLELLAGLIGSTLTRAALESKLVSGLRTADWDPGDRQDEPEQADDEHHDDPDGRGDRVQAVPDELDAENPGPSEPQEAHRVTDGT